MTDRSARGRRRPLAARLALWALCPVLSALPACSGGAGSAPPSRSQPAASQAFSSATASATPGDDSTAIEPETDWTTGDAQSPRYPTVAGHAMPDTSRVGVHPGFERVVVQYTGRASDITWRARFTGRNAAGLAGRRFLRVTVAGLRDPDEGETVPALAPAPVSGATLIKGVSVGLPRGGVQTITVGLDADAAYRLMVLENPTRLVVDLRK